MILQAELALYLLGAVGAVGDSGGAGGATAVGSNVESRDTLGALRQGAGLTIAEEGCTGGAVEEGVEEVPSCALTA
jgi:hypothetical protein